MPTRLRTWLLSPVRTPRRALVTALLVAALAVAGWYGLGALRFRGDVAAAKEALAAYDFPEARRRLAAALRWRPGGAEARLLAAQAARRDGLLDEADEHLDRYRDAVGHATPEGALQATLVLVQRGQVKQHVYTLLEYVEVRHPDTEQILEALAQGSVQTYRLDEASFFTRQLLDRFPANPVGRLIDAQTHETLRHRDQAFELARRLVEDYPNNTKARLYLAVLLAKRHRYEDAILQYEELRRRQPDDLATLLGLTRAYLTMGRAADAEPLLAELEQKHGDNSEALLQCARHALRQKRPADAEPLLRRALRLAPNDADIRLELAVCLGQLGQKEESQRHLERHKEIQADMQKLEKALEAMVKSPNDPAPRLEAGQLCLRNGQVSEGLRWLSGALELAPNHKPTHQALADYYASVGDATRAEYHRGRAK